MRVSNWISACALVLAVPAAAVAQPPTSVPDRIRGSAQVVVAVVGEISASWQTNEFGDQLIVSNVRLHVEEALKGNPARVLDMEMLGGTVGDITMEVSSLPPLARGERAVFFLDTGRNGRLIPYRRGEGILKLDSQNRVNGTSLDLNRIRQMAASAGGR